MRLFPSILTAACAAVAVSAVAAPGASAAPPSRHVAVHASKPSQAELPALHAKARIAAAATCDSSSPGPALLDAGTDPVKIAVGVHDVHSFVYAALLSDPCPISKVKVHGVRTTGESTADFPLYYVETEADGSELWGVRLEVDPVGGLLNVDAGTWHSSVRIDDDSGRHSTDAGATYYLQRWGRMTNNAHPEPVRKGATITIDGKLSRANWNDLEYHGYANHPVTLQFRTPEGSYADVKTIHTSSTGTLRTTVKASADGCFRFYFKGTTTTQAAKGVGDCVDVR